MDFKFTENRWLNESSLKRLYLYNFKKSFRYIHLEIVNNNMPAVNQNQERIKVPLNELLLNLYDSPSSDISHYSVVNYELIEKEDIQDNILRHISGRENQYIDSLVQKYKTYGYIGFDQIQVESTPNGYFLVLSGNRYVAALKYMERRFKNEEYDVGKLDSEIFEKLPVTLIKKEKKDIESDFLDAHRKLKNIINELSKELIEKNKQLLTETSTPVELIYDYPSNQLEILHLEEYKHFRSNLEVGPFNRVNIIAGENNTGKTSFLEAIYLLCHLNDRDGLYDIYHRRGKFLGDIPAGWFSKILPSKFILSGKFDGKDCKLQINKFIDTNGSIDKTDYLNSIELLASFNEEDLITTTHLYSKRDAVLYYEEAKNLCQIVMSNPFSLMNRQVIEYYHEVSVEKGVFGEIIDFIKTNIDDNIQDINKVGEDSQFRFLVTHSNSSRSDRTMDLAEFGDGVQRIFYISMMVAAAENGILCIDEVENAIHHTLLVKFTKFLQKLAERFNVQLFVSTHSNECIKAFFENEYKNEQITGFRLEKKNGEITYKKAVGKKLQLQIENFSLDLRG